MGHEEEKEKEELEEKENESWASFAGSRWEVNRNIYLTEEGKRCEIEKNAEREVGQKMKRKFSDEQDAIYESGRWTRHKKRLFTDQKISRFKLSLRKFSQRAFARSKQT